MNETNKEFYSHLGLLSTKFAEVEINVIIILGYLIVDDFVITSILLEGNSLDRNLKLLKEINKYRSFEEDAIKRLITDILAVKVDRNLFIHGRWLEPEEKGGEIAITCAISKMKFELSENEKIKTWTYRQFKKFKLKEIQKIIRAIEEILNKQHLLIKKLDGYVFD